jgi:hypothetical protein
VHIVQDFVLKLRGVIGHDHIGHHNNVQIDMLSTLPNVAWW